MNNKTSEIIILIIFFLLKNVLKFSLLKVASTQAINGLSGVANH